MNGHTKRPGAALIILFTSLADVIGVPATETN